MSAEWFRRMGDIPRVDYRPPVPVDRDRLPGHDREPEVNEYEGLDGSPLQLLFWGEKVAPGPQAGPDAEWEYEDLGPPVWAHVKDALEGDGLPAEQLIARAWEALELPGARKDYHDVLGRVCVRLATTHLTEGQVLDTVESLGWLDIKLIRVSWNLARAEHWEAGAVRTVHALYLNEGFLQEALQVAQLESRLLTGGYLEYDLQGRLAALRGERELR